MGHVVPDPGRRHRDARVGRQHDAPVDPLAGPVPDEWISCDESFRVLVENVGEGVGIVDEEERFLFVNAAGAEILGLGVQEIVGRPLSDFVVPEDWAHLLDETRRRRYGDRSVYDLTFVRPDGERRTVVVTASPSYDAQGRYRGSYGVFRDITERKAMEELVERRSSDLAERVKELQCLYSVMQELNTRERPLEEMLRSIVSLVGSGWQFPELTRTRVTVGNSVATSSDFVETPWGITADVTPRGEIIGSVEVFYCEHPPNGSEPFLDEEQSLLDSIAEQLTRWLEHSLAEGELRRSRETAQTLIDNFPGGAVLLDLDLNVIAVNAPASSMTNRDVSDIIGRSALEIFDREFGKRRAKDLKRVIKTAAPVEMEEKRAGRVYATRILPVFASDGAVERLAVFTRDVTDEQRNERAVRQSEAKYRSVFELSPEAIVLLSKKGNVLDANGRIEDWLGYSRDEIVGKNLLFLPFMTKSGKRSIVKRFFERMAGRQVQPYEVTFVTKTGFEKIGRIHGTVLFDDEGKAVSDLVMISDVTEQKRAETEMAETGRKLGELHDVVKRLATCAEMSEIYPLITEAAKDILSIDACGLFIERSGFLELAATCCQGRESRPAPVSVDDAGRLGEAFKTGRMQIFTSKDVAGGMPAPEGFERGLSMPVGKLGVLHCFSMKEGAFTTDDVRLLDLLLDHAKHAAARIEIEARLHEEAIRDRVTGLYNRNYFDEAVGREIERSRRSGEPIGFLMLDIDRFKLVNDTHGHQTGDLVLRGVARFLQGQVRTSEIVVRYGGDEFLIMMPGHAAAPDPILERFRGAFERWLEESGLPEDMDFGLSMGYSRWEPYDLTSVAEVLDEADEAMYVDKRSRAAAAPRGGSGPGVI